MAAACEYICSEILELAGNVAQEGRKKRLAPRHIMLAVSQDEELGKMLAGGLWSQAGVVPKIETVLIKGAKAQEGKNAKAHANSATQEV